MKKGEVDQKRLGGEGLLGEREERKSKKYDSHCKINGSLGRRKKIDKATNQSVFFDPGGEMRVRKNLGSPTWVGLVKGFKEFSRTRSRKKEQTV